jgi:pimeloyl-ACP methyl ester carboxylesterase
MNLLIKGFEHRTTDTGEVDIGYSVGPNNGPPLLLLHGVTSRRDGFFRVVDALTPSWRVITMDQRGHGFSGHTPGAYARADYARDVRHLLDKVIGETTVVWGHSLGGGNATEAAATDPSLVRALVLEDPALFGPSRPPVAEDSPVRANFRLFLRLVESGCSLDEMTAQLLAHNPGQGELQSRWKAECLRQMDVEMLRNVADARPLGSSDPRDLLARVACPVLLVQADPAIGGILADDYLASLAPDRESFTVARLAGTGHNINRDHPDELLGAVLPWLQAL